jgi:hypothetical protein
VAGANLEVSPHIGWANAMPDANAIADFTILGEKLQFNGVGYHDKVTPSTIYDHLKIWNWPFDRTGVMKALPRLWQAGIGAMGA